jgi:hypothetical protein
VERRHERSRNPIYRLSECLVAFPVGVHGPVPSVSGSLLLVFPPNAA